MKHNEMKQRKKFLFITLIALVAWVIDFSSNFIFSNNIGSSSELIMGFLRLAFICYICYNLYLGKNWAWITSLCLLSLALCISCFSVVFVAFVNIKLAIVLIILIILYVIEICMLLSKEMKVYFKNET